MDVILLTLMFIAAVLLYRYLTRNFSVFKNSGIPGPKPYPIFGNALEMNGVGLVNLDISWNKKYGKFVGTFIGSTPNLLVYDGEWANEAFVKYFHVFVNRNTVKFGGAIDSGILSAKGDHWRHARKTLTPAFTTLKLKNMLPAMQKCCNTFVEMLKSTEGSSVSIKVNTSLLTLDVISITAFGLESKVQENPEGRFAKNAFLLTNSSEANTTFMEKLRLALVVTFTLLCPSWVLTLISKVFDLTILNRRSTVYFESLLEMALKGREKNSEGCDLLQILANSIVETTGVLFDEAGNPWTTEGLTREEVIGNSTLFLFAGFGTTADTMSFIFYELAHHPDIQEVLYEEIIGVCDTPEVTIDQVNKLDYLQRCIKETLRLYPQGFRFDRVALEDVTINDVSIKKGTVVIVSPWVIHRNPEIWENPEDFDPDRFLPERFTSRCNATYMPFGIGNRQCIGMRLALLEMKITVINAMKAFKVQKTLQTPSRPIKLEDSVPLAPLKPAEEIKVSFICR